MSDWKAVVDRNGRLMSVGTVVADPLPSGLVVLPLLSRPDDDMWDEPSRRFVARPPPTPPVDRVNDLDASAEFRQAVQRRDQAAVLTIVGRLLGRERFRSSTESVNVGEDDE